MDLRFVSQTRRKKWSRDRDVGEDIDSAVASWPDGSIARDLVEAVDVLQVGAVSVIEVVRGGIVVERRVGHEGFDDFGQIASHT
jgi:hypothetical protein